MQGKLDFYTEAHFSTSPFVMVLFRTEYVVNIKDVCHEVNIFRSFKHGSHPHPDFGCIMYDIGSTPCTQIISYADGSDT